MAGKLNSKSSRARAIAARASERMSQRDVVEAEKHFARLIELCALDGTQEAFAQQAVIELEKHAKAIEEQRQRLVYELSNSRDRKLLDKLRAKLARSIACRNSENRGEHQALMKTSPVLLAELGAALGDREIPPMTIDALRTLATSGNVAQFEVELSNAVAKAPLRTVSLDAYERNKFNPYLAEMMRMVSGGGSVIDAAAVAAHGPRKFVAAPNLEELIANTAARGDAMGR